MPKPAEKINTVERILQSAETLFARQGFDATSTRQIAAKAQISIQTLHYHCGTKKDLYHQILERSVIPVNNMINRHVQEMLKLDLNDEEVLKNSINGLIDELFDVLYENPNFPLLFFRQWLESDSELRRVEWEQLVPYLRKWLMQVESGVDRDRLLGIDLPLTFISLSILYWGLFSNREFISAFLNMDALSPEYMERLKAHAKEVTQRLLSGKIENRTR